MFRNENDLLCSLASAIKKIKNQTNTNDNVKNNFNDIEKYRDKDGFINLTKVNDINEVSRIIDLVDKKNFIEELENNTNLQEKAEGLAKTLKDMFNIDSVKVKISTPEGESCAKIGGDYEVEKIKKEEPVQNNEVFNNNEQNDTVEQDDKKVNICEEIDEDFELDNEVIVLHSVGGEAFNAPFYNAVLYICENEYFPESGVYAEDEDYPEKVDVRILLPNVWNKITTDAIEYFEECLANGEEIYVIDPETFDLIDINNNIELWDYAMTSVQESIIHNY